MRSLLLASVLVSSVAFADKTVDAVIKKNVVELGNLADNDKLGLSEKAIVINHMGSTVDLTEEQGCVSGAVANSFYGCVQADIAHKLGAIVTGVDAAKGIAWFQVPYTVTMTGDAGDGPSTSKHTMRTGGILVKKGKRWEIVAQMYSQLVSDKELLAGTGGKPASGGPKLTGDTKLAGAIAGWFTSGFAGAAAKSGTLIASGTGNAEFKSGAAATQLAASFDKLQLGTTAVDAKVLANGAVGWATATVMMPRKNGKGAVEMRVAIVAVPEGESWRWVSFQYQFPWNPVGR